jgi:hypothetical protein
VLGRMRAAEEDVAGGHVGSWLLTMVGSTLLTTVGSGRLTSIRLLVYEMEPTIRATARGMSALLLGKDNSKDKPVRAQAVALTRETDIADDP